jgi:hypothetical protein
MRAYFSFNAMGKLRSAKKDCPSAFSPDSLYDALNVLEYPIVARST